MKILVACEESQKVCIQFRKIGHQAYSCDIQYPSGQHPEWHIKDDVLPLLNGNCKFKTLDGLEHQIVGRWDMIIAFPPCTHLAVSGASWFKKKREDGRQLEAIEFFCNFLEADCDRICIENPVNIIAGDYVKKWFPEIAKKYKLPKKPSQYVHPYFFGDKVRKKTGLWLKGLPKLEPTEMVEPELKTLKNNKTYSDYALYITDENGKILRYNDPRTGKIRSKTYIGLAKAMAEQWGK